MCLDRAGLIPHHTQLCPGLTELTSEYEYPAGQAILSCYFDPALPSACYAMPESALPVLAGRIYVHYNVNITVM